MSLIGIFGNYGGVATSRIIGRNVIVNGIFDADADWIKGLNWTIALGVLKATGVLTASNTRQLTLKVGETYEVTYTILNYVNGTIKIGTGTNWGIGRSGNGTFTQIMVCAGNTNFYILADVGGSFEIDNVIAREINNIEEDG